jgi:hypothetical protein
VLLFFRLPGPHGRGFLRQRSSPPLIISCKNSENSEALPEKGRLAFEIDRSGAPEFGLIQLKQECLLLICCSCTIVRLPMQLFVAAGGKHGAPSRLPSLRG